jgi:hypothetical protein
MWDRELERFYFYIMGYGPSFMLLVLCPLNKRYIESNTGKSARQGNLTRGCQRFPCLALFAGV